ncbi:cinnamoyl-CoA reductase-like SNL6 [Ananas comosus]|uniref:Cinnamoyl-CoA reductase-like SNL6 n=1 Tax=Ananas comosus TaxID=4615 RepID=A0A6P5FK65_ANACO|nr:cinnamoyl-CoA reductase-like SNL6 [Ananas comosus]
MAPACNTKAVCVMDTSAHFGSTLVERLLRRGYTVHAAAYEQGGFDKLKSKSISCENKRLRVFRSDPFDYQSIVEAMKGCSGLFYTFEPPQDQPSYDEFMVEVEVRAAHNVLEACARTETMERVVFTSSVTAVVWKGTEESRQLTPATPEEVDERDWSEPNFCRKFKLWHALAKTLSEKTAWALAMDRGVDMVSVNAGLVVDPMLSADNPYLKGAVEMYDDGVLVTVAIDFLADAHIAVYESPSAYGRYLCFDRSICRPEDTIKLAQMLSPTAASNPSPSDELRVIQKRIQNKKLSKVMVQFGSGRHMDLE